MYSGITHQAFTLPTADLFMKIFPLAYQGFVYALDQFMTREMATEIALRKCT
jgi:hypothetical protein